LKRSEKNIHLKTKEHLPESQKPISAKLSRGRKWFFIFVLTVVMPAILILLLEFGLRIAGYGSPSGFFVKRQIDGQPYFTDNIKFGLRFFPPKLARPSCRMAIPADKPSGTFRIFVLGGSAAMGDPDFSFGFSRMLEAMLQHQYPDVRIEVINAAVTAINSNVVLPIAKDCAKLRPDLFVVYLGNNEVIGPYGPGTVFAPFLSSLAFIRTSIFLSTTKIGQLLSDLRQQMSTDKTDVQEWGGVEMFIQNRLRFDDPRMTAVYDHFRDNLSDICQVGHRAGARVIVSTVPTNLKDCAPFGSLHREDLSSTSINEWNDSYNAGITADSSGRFEEAIAHYLKAAGIDDEFADLQFRLARCYQALSQDDKALDYFIKARDLDALRFRADTQINDIIRKIASTGCSEFVTLVDAEKAFQTESVHGIPGESLFYDHVHTNFKGNYLLSRLIKEQVEKIFAMKSQEQTFSEAECAARLAFTPWDAYRMQKEILERMKSPAFANQLDNAESVRRAEARLDSLRKCLQADALDGAVQNYRQEIKANENDWVLRNNFGLLFLETGSDLGSAIEQFRFVLHLFPSDYLTLNNLGLVFARQNKLNEAIDCYNKALLIKPDFSKASFNLAELLERQGRYDEAIKLLYQAHLPKQGLADAHNRFGIKLANEGRSDEAVTQFEDALRLWPDSPDAHRNLGNVFAKMGRTDLAIQHLLEAVRIRPDLPGGYIDLASLLFTQGDYENAVEHYEKALQIKPDIPEVENNLGLALCKMGQFEQAIPHFQKALLSRHDFLSARNNLAGALSQLGRSKEAIAQLQESLRISPNNPEFHNNIGAELLRLGEIEQAITHFKKALQLNPDLPSARNNLKIALSRLEAINKTRR
jgi:tetratricopeptide (TPR) repeat protein